MPDHPPIACNEYSWRTFLQRDGRTLHPELENILATLAEQGYHGYEPNIFSPEGMAEMAEAAERHGLALTSIYVGPTLHDAGAVDENIDYMMAIAAVAAAAGTRILVTNPEPLPAGSAQGQDKDDSQLATQAAALDRLGAALREHAITLAYHNHAREFRQAAREFHHMMLATDPANVSLCLDAHWIYRGAGNSQIALFDVVQLYRDRVVEVHLRQSAHEIWSETFGPGDIDYQRLRRELAVASSTPHLVLEQSIEQTSPQTLDSATAHAQSLANAQSLFAGA